MARTKIAVSLDSSLLERLDRLAAERVVPSRSWAVQEAVRDQMARISRARLARECAKLDPLAERAMADEGLSVDAGDWPAY
ncbi:MAG TPA: ribbon-helix-helix domain-containing protein [Isosphaeraceae bacterium]|nr:ribbon-helix-helix domain-containing protein [Isosphaeraceae bacterium]